MVLSKLDKTKTVLALFNKKYLNPTFFKIFNQKRTQGACSVIGCSWNFSERLLSDDIQADRGASGQEEKGKQGKKERLKCWFVCFTSNYCLLSRLYFNLIPCKLKKTPADSWSEPSGSESRTIFPSKHKSIPGFREGVQPNLVRMVTDKKAKELPQE